ncbi:caspase family protein [Arthrobacter sp. HLT1-20]
MTDIEPGVARGRRYTDEERAKLKAHVVAMRNGRLYDGPADAAFTTSQADIAELAQAIGTFVDERRSSHPNSSVPVMMYSHGGLVSPENALEYALDTIDWWRSLGVYPVYFVWDSDFWSALGGAMQRAIKGWWSGGRGGPLDYVDGRIELLLHNHLGPEVWGEMKLDAVAASSADGGAANLFAQYLAPQVLARGDAISLHAVGHSAGSIFHSAFLPLLVGAHIDIESLSLLAPAIRVDTYLKTLHPLISEEKIKHVAMFTMDDHTEQKDDCFKLYNKSLLYLIRGAFEKEYSAEILGLERCIKANETLKATFRIDGGRADLVLSNGKAGAVPRWMTEASSHGDFDTDPYTMQSVACRIVGTDSVPAFPASRTRGEGGVSAFKPAPIALPDDPSKWAPRRALCIGIDEYATQPLHGCVADAEAWQVALEALDFQVTPLHNEAATREGILREITLLVANSRPKDVLVVQYSGHGTEVEDLDGDEAFRRGPAAVMDQALVPSGSGFGTTSGEYVVDDDLGAIWNTLPKDVSLTFFFDSCHSGDNIRGELTASGRGAAAVVATAPIPNLDVRYMALGPIEQQAFADARGNPVPATVAIPNAAISFSACSPDQVAYESNQRGIFSAVAVPLIADAVGRMTNEQFIALVLSKMGVSAPQTPGFYGDDKYLKSPFLGLPASAAAAPGLPEAEGSPSDVERLLRAGVRAEVVARWLRATADLLES